MEAYQIALIAIGSTVVFLLALSFVFGHVMYRMVVHPKGIRSYQDMREDEDGPKKGFLKRYDAEYEVDELSIETGSGYQVAAELIASAKESKRFVIIAHGYRCNMLASVKYVNLFHDFGYNCLIFDERGHGKNERVPITMGWKESECINDLIGYLRKRYGESIYVGLHGESMGAASSLMALRFENKVDFVVDDCGYASLAPFLRKVGLNDIPVVSRYLLWWASLNARIFAGFSFYKVNPCEAISRRKDTHLLVMHGKDDRMVGAQNAEAIYAKASCDKEIHLYENAGHAQSYPLNQDAYREDLRSFLERIGGLDN